ncbi:hypothetical protein A0H81_08853 [Grifola frondosa]|uniref:Uncharacterized protein n=1 Tax=Grifola frondosa TaxID=5627 RepID=A0A1C7M3P6_GRIFR|nr:hypothetical protein A0H81_08853 [Grifola frondosa]
MYAGDALTTYELFDFDEIEADCVAHLFTTLNTSVALEDVLSDNPGRVHVASYLEFPPIYNLAKCGVLLHYARYLI